jgi:hypothetical protein
MQNQMMPKINLLQMPDPAARTAKYVNMMNAAKQQEAAERQAAMAQETLDLKKKEDVREEALQTPRLNKAQQENILDALKIFREGVADIAEGDVAAAEAVRADLVARIPGWDKVIPPATTWDRDTRYRLMVEADKEYDKTFATPVAREAVNDRTGQLSSITVGGLDPRAEVIGEVAPRTPMAPAPRATPTAPTAAPANPFAPGYAPNTAAAPPNSLSLVVDSALETGVMAKADFDKLVSIAQPGSGPKLQAWAKQNNIQIAPDAPGITDNQMRGAPADFQASPMSYDGQTPESQFAVYRGQPMQSQTAGLDSAPQMQNVMAQSQGRTPFIPRRESPTPGIFGVPTGQVAETSRAQRASPGELYDVEAAKIKAARDAGPAPSTPQQKRARKTEVANAYTKTQTLVDRAYDPKEGVVSLARKIKALSPDQKEAITGLSGYVPSFRGSTKEADTLIGNLKGIVTALGKDTAAASGNIGPMAAQEWKTVADMIADLKLEGMTPRALDAQMDRIIRQVDLATNLAQRVYDIQFSDDIKEYPEFRVRGNPSARTKTPVVKGGSRISPDIDKILKSRGL